MFSRGGQLTYWFLNKTIESMRQRVFVNEKQTIFLLFIHTPENRCFHLNLLRSGRHHRKYGTLFL